MLQTSALMGFLLLIAPSIYAIDFDLKSRGILTIQVPEKWVVSPVDDGKHTDYTLALKPSNDANAKCLVTFVYIDKTELNPEKIREKAREAGEHFVADSVEKKVVLKDFSLKQGYGAYCVLTDASMAGKPTNSGEYKVMGCGIFQLSDRLFGAVTLLADDAKGIEFETMLRAVNSMKLKAKGAE